VLVLALSWAVAHSETPPLLDQVGHRVETGTARRIVALAPDVAELAFALGLGPAVVAVGPAVDYPERAASLPHLGALDVESVLVWRPDLVLATTAGSDPRLVERLRALGLRTLTVDVTSCARLVEACTLVAAATTAGDAGAVLASGLRGRCAEASRRGAKLPRRGALYVVWWDPLIVAAPGTFHDDLLRHANLSNLAPANAGRYPRVSPELLLSSAVEVVVSPDEPDARALFARVVATAAGARLARGAARVIWLPADPASRPGPRLPEAYVALVAERERAP
jgi:iron complex transport system substrate-binding protein